MLDLNDHTEKPETVIGVSRVRDFSHTIAMRVVTHTCKFCSQICHQWHSRFSFSSTKTTMCVVIRRFRSREICFTWRNWRLTCTATQRVTTCCVSVACGFVGWIHDWCTEGCLCDHLAVVKVGKFMIYLPVTILTWVSIVMKLKWMWEWWKGLGILKRKPKAIMLVFMLACTYVVWNTLVELK